ncbi:hypothetical protein ASE14_00205 [Agromyces sp. Root81]|uniref:peptidoglycan-binding domain-containing protein n=1 Tax=Agromyces sp. Root81 TaxID=1736601 RepID=UPI0006F69F13|nr:peptidoglycan-binding domain-containing protein [Agromyces sp. Root81]KRC62315.1 hypothetical protein ASE14_00205 [Agromyces sp. Root81]
MSGKARFGWRDLRFIAPVVLCFAVPIVALVALVPLAQHGEEAAASSPLPATVEVGSREADFRQSIGVEFTLNPAGVVKTNASGRVTAVHVDVGGQISSGTKLIDVDGAPVFAMPQTPPLYRDLARGMEGADVASMQQFLVAGGFLADSTDNVDGDFGGATADAVCEFQEAAGLECTEVFATARVAYVPQTVASVGSVAAKVGDTLTADDPILSGTATPSAAELTPAAENGDLTAYGDEPVIVSTSDGGEVPLPWASGLDAASVDALYVFVQAAVAAGEIAAPEAPKGEDAEAASSASYTGLMLRKEAPSVVAVVPGTSVLTNADGGSCVITVSDAGSGSSSGPGRHTAVKLENVAPAVGQLGQVFTDANLAGSVILRDPTTAPSKAQAGCS